MKEYKISIKPYLNKRVHPIRILRTQNGIRKEVDTWPLYYQVVYKRKNNNFRSAYSIFHNRYPVSYESPEIQSHLSDVPLKLIERDTKVITSIIRYMESKDSNFSIVGFKKIYDEYSICLAELVNDKLLLLLRLMVASHIHPAGASLFNLHDGSAYTIYKYIDIFFKGHDIFSEEQHELFRALKSFIVFFGEEEEGPSEYDLMEHYVDYTIDYYNHPLLIDYYSGELRKSLLIAYKKEEVDKIMYFINWILEYNTWPY